MVLKRRVYNRRFDVALDLVLRKRVPVEGKVRDFRRE